MVNGHISSCPKGIHEGTFKLMKLAPIYYYYQSVGNDCFIERYVQEKRIRNCF